MAHEHCKDASEFCKSGYFKYCLQDYQGALADYTKAIDLKPCCGSAYKNRGLIHQLLRQNVEAVADFARAGRFGVPGNAKNLNTNN